MCIRDSLYTFLKLIFSITLHSIIKTKIRNNIFFLKADLVHKNCILVCFLITDFCISILTPVMCNEFPDEVTGPVLASKAFKIEK